MVLFTGLPGRLQYKATKIPPRRLLGSGRFLVPYPGGGGGGGGGVAQDTQASPQPPRPRNGIILCLNNRSYLGYIISFSYPIDSQLSVRRVGT